MKAISKDEFVEAQRKYCRRRSIPMFISTDGLCWKCREYIFKDKQTRENAGDRHIVSCPFCHRSYCD